MRRQIISLIILLALAGCNVKTAPAVTEKETQDALLLSVLWYQKSGEMRALYYQCYYNAGQALEKNIKTATNAKPPAVVLDIDETVLDNSPFEAWEILNNKKYSDVDWDIWVNRAEAKALPGAVAFTRLADSLGVEVFYISNRSAGTREATLKNLLSEGFPVAGDDHLILKENGSSKIERRERVAEKYNIVLLVGDNLDDLNGIFEKRPDGTAFDNVDKQKDLFGSRYIILPDPMYGTWLSELLKTAKGTTDREKLHSLLTGY